MAPEPEARAPAFALTPKKAITADDAELAGNPRARLRQAAASRPGPREPATPVDRAVLGLPRLAGGVLMRGFASVFALVVVMALGYWPITRRS